MAELFNPLVTRPPRLAQILDDFIALAGPKVEAVRNVLNQGREARNYVAHESGNYDLFSDTIYAAVDRLKALRPQMRALIAADAVVSRWSHGLEEPHDPPDRIFVVEYPERLEAWVFAPVEHLFLAPLPPSPPPRRGYNGSCDATTAS